MTKLILNASLLLILLSAFSCTNAKKQNEKDLDSTVSVDLNLVENFLKDPRNSLILDTLEYETECVLNKNEDPFKNISLKRAYHDCEYMNKDKKIAVMTYSVFRTDSTWIFGMNGFEIYSFETDQQSFPLKNGLEIGSTIQDFTEFFGTQKILKNQYLYDFEFELFSSKLILSVDNNTVIKISLVNK